ncbi:hypothetical protein TNCV_3036521 [Trichonephila clavipes]|nr:hypothetical protein TNCV_3036521 [Trichonephila clavipes]
MKCANCSGAHAANWSRCPKHPNNAKKKTQNKNKNGPNKPKNVPKKTTPQAPRPDISKARKVSPNLDYSKVVQTKFPGSMIGFWNANSLRNKIHEVREFVNEQNFDLFLVQETWLEPGIDPQIANYRLFKDDRIEFPHTGSTAITPIEKAEVIADSLQEQFEPNHVADREVFDQRIHEEVANFLATPHVQEIEPTTPTEVLTYVQRIKPKNPRT